MQKNKNNNKQRNKKKKKKEETRQMDIENIKLSERGWS